MHTAQIILVEIEDEETDSPQEFAESFLQNASENGGEWFDWYGGLGEGLAGRWAGEIFEGDVLRYSDNPELAEKVIDEALASRKQEVESSRAVLADFATESALYDPENQGKYDREGYALYKMGQVLSNFWCSDSGIYDSVTWDANLKNFRERVQKNPEKQYLVVVDFHF
jgi:hypothetical protein